MKSVKQKHTPGPWKAVQSPVNGKDFAIYSVHDNPSKDLSIARCDFRDNNEANARLLATAPEMLELLIGMVRLLEAGVLPMLAVEKAKDVIARATGDGT